MVIRCQESNQRIQRMISLRCPLQACAELSEAINEEFRFLSESVHGDVLDR